jgi:hypothetical protein
MFTTRTTCGAGGPRRQASGKMKAPCPYRSPPSSKRKSKSTCQMNCGRCLCATSNPYPVNLMNEPTGFAEVFLNSIWASLNRKRMSETDQYEDIRAALYALRTMSGLSVEELAARTGMVPHRLALLEKRGSPVEVRDIELFKRIANEYSLFKLEVYFDRQILLYTDKLRKNRRKPQK